MSFLILSAFLLAGGVSFAVTFEAVDDLSALGTNGTVSNPDFEIKGFSIFGSTDVLTFISTAPGNTVFNGAVQISSDVYVAGASTFTGTITASSIRGLSAPLSGDAPATKDYVDAALDTCAFGNAAPGDILLGKTADINCDNFAELGTLATVTLDPANDTVLAGVYVSTTLSLVDPDLAAGNIRSGYTIFGKAGTFTSGVTAAAGDIISGKTAGVNGAIITGTLATQTLDPANDTVLAGVYVSTTLSLVDPDLAVGNIKTGVTIFGKAGTYAGSGYALPDTGQTTSYDIGDDADYNPAATQLSYTVNADNTITDNKTGLMWRRCSQGMNDDATCTGTAATYTWTLALAQCEAETTDYSDWRLPNMKELFSIIKFEGAAPFIDQTTFPATVSSYYWSSTTYVPNATYAMDVHFNDGSVLLDLKPNYDYVRCVRAGP